MRGRIILMMGVMALALGAAACASQPPVSAAPSKLFVNADVVQGTKNLPADQMAAKTCVVSSRYPKNSELLWRVRVSDPKTGEEMDDKALSKVEVKLADGKVFSAKYGKHGDAAYFWTAVWTVPKDYPSGTVNYTIVATATDGWTGEYKPIDVAPSLLTITNDVLPDAPAAPPKS